MLNSEIKQILEDHAIESFDANGKIYGVMDCTQYRRNGERFAMQEITNLTGYTTKQLKHYLGY